MNLKRLLVFLLAPVFSLSMIFNQSAYAEWYLGGAVGIAIPHNVDNLAISGSAFSVDISSFSPDTSFTGGISGAITRHSLAIASSRDLERTSGESR